jgi:hypothetical protein
MDSINLYPEIKIGNVDKQEINTLLSVKYVTMPEITIDDAKYQLNHYKRHCLLEQYKSFPEGSVAEVNAMITSLRGQLNDNYQLLRVSQERVIVEQRRKALNDELTKLNSARIEDKKEDIEKTKNSIATLNSKIESSSKVDRAVEMKKQAEDCIALYNKYTDDQVM